YLAERGIRGETPKELEIAIDVFGRDASFNSAEESLVRVAVRGLRRRLHDYYAGVGQGDEWRFDVPKRGYRLARAGDEPAAPAEEPPARLETEPEKLPSGAPAEQHAPRGSSWLRSWAIAATLLLMFSLTFNVYQGQQRSRFAADPKIAEIARTPLWSGIIDSDRPVMLFLGDSFMYTS